ncbi:MAG: hypothetical protein QXD69_04490, partial [Candidatus Bathyarchaeia archaeon]
DVVVDNEISRMKILRKRPGQKARFPKATAGPGFKEVSRTGEQPVSDVAPQGGKGDPPRTTPVIHKTGWEGVAISPLLQLSHFMLIFL